MTRWGDRWPACAAVVWCLIFAALHVFWAAGGTMGLAVSAGAELARRRPAWFVLGGLWGVAALLLVAAAVAASMAHPPGSPRVRRVVRAAGWLVVVLLALRAVPTLIQDLLTESGQLVPPAGSGTDWTLLHWRLALWTPWFLLGGGLFALVLARTRTKVGTP